MLDGYINFIGKNYLAIAITAIILSLKPTRSAVTSTETAPASSFNANAFSQIGCSTRCDMRVFPP